MNSKRIDNVKYSKQFVTRAACIYLAHGPLIAGMFCAYAGVPAAHVSRLLGLYRASTTLGE